MQQVDVPLTNLGYSLAADWHMGINQNHVLLVIVGYGSTKARNAEFVANIVRQTGSNAFVLDLSGHGESPHKLDHTAPAQHLLEVIAAFDWLQSKHPEASISVMGTSYGGYLAAWLAHFRDFHRLVLRTPALYRPEDFYSPHVRIPKSDALATYRADIGQIRRNPIFLQELVFSGETLLVVHGNDEAVPRATTDLYQQTFQATPYMAKNFFHALRDPRNPEEEMVEYTAAIASWLQ